MEDNIILLTDSYKLSHAVQYPPKTENIYSYFESRVGAQFPQTVFLGLQPIIKRYLEGEVVTAEKIREARAFSAAHMGPGIFNEEGWNRINRVHHGRLPLRIKAVPEGSVHPTGTPLMTVESTDPGCAFLTNAVETLLTHVWYPSTVASLSRRIKEILREELILTGCEDPDAVLEFMLHGFEFRGVESPEAAGVGGMGHLVNFKGTDNIQAIRYAQEYYGCEGMPAFSVPASEHSTMTTWGEEGEIDAYRNMLRQYPSGIVSIVADSWDFENAVANLFGKALREDILARDGKTVIRPDSGDPISVNDAAAISLMDSFGSTSTRTGHRRLNPKVGLLQGDGMNLSSIKEFFETTREFGWAAENWVIGMGGGLAQKVNRDTQRFAFKCSSAIIDGEERDVFKRPATDWSKNSKRGRFTENLETVFCNGSLERKQSWESVVENAKL